MYINDDFLYLSCIYILSYKYLFYSYLFSLFLASGCFPIAHLHRFSKIFYKFFNISFIIRIIITYLYLLLCSLLSFSIGLSQFLNIHTILVSVQSIVSLSNPTVTSHSYFLVDNSVLAARKLLLLKSSNLLAYSTHLTDVYKRQR